MGTSRSSFAAAVVRFLWVPVRAPLGAAEAAHKQPTLAALGIPLFFFVSWFGAQGKHASPSDQHQHSYMRHIAHYLPINNCITGAFLTFLAQFVILLFVIE
ncbi:hypothetical protein VTI28DRAFT_1897 [Corynascus sepedonium]